VSQRLPIGAVTSPHAVRVRRAPRSPWRLRPHLLALLGGLAAAAAGAALLASPAPVAVRLGSAGYEIGGARLAPAGPGTYRGPGGAALLMVHAGGTTRAGASAVMNGSHVTGTCTLPDGAASEACRFTVAGRPLGATDTWTGAGWSRRYDDGRTVQIAVSGGRPLPVPFPVGR
jgi:hypothetical protein